MMNVQINYNLRDSRQRESTVIMICRWQGKTLKISTQLTVFTQAFDKNEQRCYTSKERFNEVINRQSRKVNKCLDKITKNLESFFDKKPPKATKQMTEDEYIRHHAKSVIDAVLGIVADKTTIEKNVKPKETKKVWKPIQFFEYYIEQKRIDPHTGRYIGERTKAHQRTVIKRLKMFLKDTHLPNEFATFCSSKFDAQFTEWCYAKKKYKQNTVYATYGVLKPLLNASKAEGIDVGEEYKHLKGKCVDVDAIYLTEDEIERIYRLDIPALIAKGEIDSKSEIEKTRDLFIIGCWTGLRRSDVNRLHKASFNIEQKTISITAEKTKRQVVIPMHPFILELWEKYQGKFPHLCDRGKTNDHLRECARHAGIDEEVRIVENRAGVVNTLTYKKYQLVGMHTGRRSFCTNMYKRRFPTISIMRLSGHTTEANFLKYIRITAEENAVMMAEEFNKAKTPFDGDFSKKEGNEEEEMKG